MKLLEVDNVTVRYGAVEALKGVSIAAETSQIVALLGANGAGKSTLLGAISGLLPVAAGAVSFDGQKISGRRPDRIVRAGLALVPERRDLFPDMSVLENLEMGAYVRSDAAEVRRDLGIVYGYFPILAERRRQIASTLSGGEQQMLAVGRALMARPRLLMLDELSLGIAPRIVEALFGIVERINREQKTTILLVEQNTSLALAVASYAYVLETGRIAAQGPAAELAKSDLVRKSYLGENEAAQ